MLQAISPQQKEFRMFLSKYNFSKFEFRLEKECKVTSISQLKQIDDPSLQSISMNNNDIKKLRKFMKKEYPHGFNGLNKFKKMLHRSESTPNDNHEMSLQLDRNDITFGKTSKLTFFGQITDVQLFSGTNKQRSAIVRRIKCKKIQAPLEVFIQEVKIGISLNCEHLLNNLALVSARDEQDADEFILVMESCMCLSLKQAFIESVPCPTLSELRNFSLLHDYAMQITEAMFFLEERQLVHGDLSLSKCLIFPNYKLKISDFGLSRAVGASMKYYRGELSGPSECPLPWVSPERIAPESVGEAEFSSSSDVWSYGFTLWELFNRGKTPWCELTNSQILDEILSTNGRRPNLPENTTSQYQKIISNCWMFDPRKRSKFQTLELQLSNMKINKVLAKQCSDNLCTLAYIENEIILVLDESPNNAPQGYAMGSNTKGDVGLFNLTNTRSLSGSPEPKQNQVQMRQSSPRSNTISSTNSMLAAEKKKRLTTSMISAPKDDMRHTGHVGCDGSTFGDVSVIASKLPVLKSNSGQSNGTDYSDEEFKEYDFGPSLMDEMMDIMNFEMNGDSEPTPTGNACLGRGESFVAPISTQNYRKKYTPSDALASIPSPELHSPQSVTSSISFGCIEDEDLDLDEEEEEPNSSFQNTSLSTPLNHSSVSRTSSDRSSSRPIGDQRSSHVTTSSRDQESDLSCQSLDSIEVTDKRFDEQNNESRMSQKPNSLDLRVKDLSPSDQKAIDTAIDVITTATDRVMTPCSAPRSPKSSPSSSHHSSSSSSSCRTSSRLFGRGKQNTSNGGGAVEVPGEEAYAALVGGSLSTITTTATTTTTTTSSSTSITNNRQRSSFRTPIGIPDSPHSAHNQHHQHNSSGNSSPVTDETNPLRRLRAQTGSGSSSHSATSNLYFTTKPTLDNHAHSANNTSASSGPARPPPRQSPTSAANSSHSLASSSPSSSAPRQRRYPLVLDTVGVTQNSSNSSNSSVAYNNSTNTILSGATTPQQYNVRSVHLTAVQLGLGDASDSFWTSKVNFGQVEMPNGDKGSSPNYKTEEVLLMRKILSRDVTVQDCCTALTECKVNLSAAIKLLKLRQLISTRLTEDNETCKRVLLQSDWNVDEAANRLAKGDTSDLVHL